MRIADFIVAYARYRRTGLTECEAFDGAMSRPKKRSLPVARVAAGRPQPEVGYLGKTPAGSDAANMTLPPQHAQARQSFSVGGRCHLQLVK